MKTEKALWSSISLLIGAVIIILSLLRGAWQVGFLLAAFVLWGGWVVKFLLMPYINQAKRRMIRKAQRERRFSEVLLQTETENTLATQMNTTTETMMRHVNHRITAYLHAIYPNATWSWEDKSPEQVVMTGGIARIKVYGADDFTHADVMLDKNGNIRCSMVKAVAIAELAASNSGADPVPPNKQPIDPQIWFETSGRAVLEDVMADLNSRGYCSLLLKENGDIVIEQDKKDVTAEKLSGFPAKVYWPRLIKVLQGEGLGAKTLAKGIQVSW